MSAGHAQVPEPKTRTAPARPPAGYPLAFGRYRNYILFGATSFFMLIGVVLLLFGIAALGRGPEAWQGYLAALGSPLLLLLTVVVLLNTIYFAVRFGWVGRKIAGARLMGYPVSPPAPLEVHGLLLPGGFAFGWLLVLLVLGGLIL